MKKLLASLFVLVLLVSMLAGCTSDDDVLVVGMELAYPPFETKDEQGEPYGLSIALANALGEYLERPVRIENINWDGLIPSLQTDVVDIVISSMTIRADRLELVDFSIPYANAYLALLVNKDSGITNVDDLNQSGKVISVKKGTTGHFYAQDFLSNATINALSSENACVIEVTQGKADAFIYDQLTIYRQNLANPDTTSAILIPFQDSEHWGIAVKKGNTELVNQINEFIESFRADGGFETLTQNYLAEEKATFDSLGFPWFFE